MEISQALKDKGVTCHLPRSLDIHDAAVEDGETYEDNATKKARHCFEQSNKMPTLADDSGIIVEALQNELGVYTRRWGAGPEASDDQWIAFFLDRMRSEQNKRARFVCAMCFIDDKGEEHLFEGSCDGTITDELQADFLPGLPISACFRPDGYEKVYSALSVTEKNIVSHRGKALQAFIKFFTHA